MTYKKRPAVLHGLTVRVDTPCGSLYVTCNYDESSLFEVFAQMGKSGGCLAASTEALCRVISLGLRSGVSPSDVQKQIKGIHCPNVSYGNADVNPDGNRITSCPDAIATVIRFAEQQRKKEEKPETGKLHVIVAFSEVG